MPLLSRLFNAQKILGQSRYPWIDYARGICILLVVYRHVFEGLGNVGVGSSAYPVLKYINIFLFSFRMPLFFIVSGIFLGGSLARKGLGEYVNNRFQTIFYPLLIWGSIQVTLQLVFAGYVNASRTPMDYINLVIEPRRIEQFWYLNALFFVSVLYALMRWYFKLKPVQHFMIGILFYVLAGYCHLNQINIGLFLDILFFYLFFAVGDMAGAWILHAKNQATLTSTRTLLLLLPVFIGAQCLFTYLNLEQGDDYYVQFKQPALFALTALVGGAFVINLSFVLQRLNIFRFLRIIGYHSLYIYVMHLMIAAAARVVLVKVFHLQNIPLLMLLCITIGVILPVILYNLAEMAGAWWLFTARKTSKRKPVVQPSLYFGPGIVTPRESTDDQKVNDQQ